jgi:hypothetical protein
LLIAPLSLIYHISFSYLFHRFQLLLAPLAFVSHTVFVAFRTSSNCL